ncbi:MAG: flagellar basal body P-ring protein FlgI [Acidobacteriota bacterium]
MKTVRRPSKSRLLTLLVRVGVDVARRSRDSRTVLTTASLVRVISVALFLAVLGAGTGPRAAAQVRIKDLARIEGVRSNPLVGYGIVTGLAGTGDGTQATFTTQSVANFLRRLGVFIDPDDIRLRNAAAALVTADLPAFARPGARIDVTVSSLGDAKSLQGGTLMMTPLRAADGEVYAVAQGAVSVGGGFSSGAGGNSVVKNHVHAGRIPAGAVVERGVEFDLGHGPLRLLLDLPDPTTADRMATVVDETMGEGTATIETPGSILLSPPLGTTVLTSWLARLERLMVEPDVPARVVFNEKTGTVVLGADLRISPVAVAHGNLSVEIQADPVISQPAPFSPQGETVNTRAFEVRTNEDDSRLVPVSGVSLGDLILSLNSLGVTSRDLIAILQALREAGALHAEIVVL